MSKYLVLFLLGTKIYGTNPTMHYQFDIEAQAARQQNYLPRDTDDEETLTASTANIINSARQIGKQWDESSNAIMGESIAPSTNGSAKQNQDVINDLITNNKPQRQWDESSNAIMGASIAPSTNRSAKQNQDVINELIKNNKPQKQWDESSNAIMGESILSIKPQPVAIQNPQERVLFDLSMPPTPRKVDSKLSVRSGIMVECTEKGCKNSVKVDGALKLNPNVKIVCNQNGCGGQTQILNGNSNPIVGAKIDNKGGFNLTFGGCCGNPKKRPEPQNNSPFKRPVNNSPAKIAQSP